MNALTTLTPTGPARRTPGHETSVRVKHDGLYTAPSSETGTEWTGQLQTIWYDEGQSAGSVWARLQGRMTVAKKDGTLGRRQVQVDVPSRHVPVSVRRALVAANPHLGTFFAVRGPHRVTPIASL